MTLGMALIIAAGCVATVNVKRQETRHTDTAPKT